MIQGQLILVSAPSGAGKTSLVSAALESDPQLVVAVVTQLENLVLARKMALITIL